MTPISSTPGRPTSPTSAARPSIRGQGRELGREQGIVEGAVRAKAEAILKILDARRLKPTKSQRGQVNAATDLAQLDRWFDRALTAATAAEVFAD
jgi:hypothetical protein